MDAMLRSLYSRAKAAANSVIFGSVARSVPNSNKVAALAWDSGAHPVIVLNKADLRGGSDDRESRLASMGWNVPIHTISALTDDGCASLAPYCAPGKTVAIVGSSGVGKSTLLNRLLGGDELATGPVRESDRKGKHTTTARELFLLPNGAALIDTPGMREIHLWLSAGGLDETFSDIEALARSCRFSDCSHETEPRCAVRAALGTTLDAAHLEGYRKLLRERAFLEQKVDPETRAAEHARWKRRTLDARQHMKMKYERR